MCSTMIEGLAEATPPVERQSNPLLNEEQSASLHARIEALEVEVEMLKKSKDTQFRIEHICGDDKLVEFYTGFRCYAIFLAFFKFLGPAVSHLNYWGCNVSEYPQKQKRMMKIDPMNQLFMTLMKLRINLKTLDLSYRFGISVSAVSRCITTWICFMYHQLKEIDWMPSVEQVAGTLPAVFSENYPTTYAIIDGSEIFLEIPTDLCMQSSTWSNYKHHNTAKFLVACTPNGCISYISSLYVGSISDVELTRTSGFLTQLKDKPGISIMADRGFTTNEMLQAIGVELNIPPFMEGQQQLSAEEVQQGRSIASCRIHVERAIGRIKGFNILKNTLPISMTRLANQIVSVCAYLSNFKTVLLSSNTLGSDDGMEVDKYFGNISDIEDNQSDDDNERENNDLTV